jgi:hypothetical protein
MTMPALVPRCLLALLCACQVVSDDVPSKDVAIEDPDIPVVVDTDADTPDPPADTDWAYDTATPPADTAVPADTGLPTPQTDCPVGWTRNCWGVCDVDTRADGVCDPWFACADLDWDTHDCGGPVDTVCPPGTTHSCWGNCEPVGSQALCDAAFDCPQRRWDDGACPAAPGTTYTGSWVVDHPLDLVALSAVDHLDGVLTLDAGAPADVVLPIASASEIHIDGNGIRTVSLPALRWLGRSLTARSSALVSLSAPVLEMTGGAVTFERTGAVAVSMPALTRVGGPLHVEYPRDGAVIDLPSLEHIAGGLGIWDGVETLNLPSLRTVYDLTLATGPLEEVVLPELVTAGAVRLRGLYALQRFEAPQLRHVDSLTLSGLIDPTLAFDALESVADVLDVQTWQQRTLSLPALTVANRIAVSGTLDALHLPALVVVDDMDVELCATDVDLSALRTATALSLDNRCGPVDLSLPVLETADDLFIDTNYGHLALPSLRHGDHHHLQMGSLDAPLADPRSAILDVQSSRDVVFGMQRGDSLWLRHNRGVAVSISLPALTELGVGGTPHRASHLCPDHGLCLESLMPGQVSAPLLTTSNAIVSRRTSALLDAPLLQEVGSLYVSDATRRDPLVLPSLTRADVVAITDVDGLETISLPALTEVHEALTFDDLPDLGQLDLVVEGHHPSLALTLRDLPALYRPLGLPRLGEVGVFHVESAVITDLFLPTLGRATVVLEDVPELGLASLPALHTAPSFTVRDADVLTDLEVFSLASVSVLTVRDAPALPVCAVEDLASGLTVTGPVDIGSNLGCP